ncbi:SapC family protein, partial [Staphylococcus aureus]|uniref:SapC family protein n=1 Tax=Staphylococcus aureus TaxID=1280 RepID=UPI0039BE05F3
PDGTWSGETYIPAFLRRYPFAVATAETSDGLSVCVDQSFVCDGEEGVRLFDEQGGDSPVLSGAMRFLADYQQATGRTQAFMQSLRDSGLLVAKTIQVERPGHPPRSLHGFCVVDEVRLQKLSGRALQKLSQSGVLGLLYVHL